jgi:hypothetical protein
VISLPSLARAVVPAIPPAKPQQKFAEALVAAGMPPEAAAAASRIVLDPTDARRRMVSPTIHRTASAQILTVPVQVTPVGVTVLPSNRRVTPLIRPLPIDGRHTEHPVLGEPTANGFEPELRVRAASLDHLAGVVAAAEDTLRIENPLDDRIAMEGILRPLLLIPLRVSFDDGTPDLVIMVTLDGSSRTASAHALLELSPAEVLSRFQDDRYLRRRMGEWRAQAPSDLDADEASPLRALAAPAELVIGVEPLTDTPVTDTASEARSFVGLLHVEPAKKWSDAGVLDAQGDEVLDELLASDVIDEDEYRVFAGLATIDEAAATGVARFHDERAAGILKLFVAHPTEVRRAIIRVTHLAQVRHARKAKVAAELAIRSFRGPETQRNTGRARIGLQLAYSAEEIWTRPWASTKRSPDELRDAALMELDAGTQFGPAALELGVKGAYELARMRVLVQINLTRDMDRDLLNLLQSPSTIFRDLMTTQHGVRVLAEALKAGRRSMVVYVVDEQGDPVPNDKGEAMPMTDAWLRKNFGVRDGDLPAVPLPTAETARDRLRVAEESVAGAAGNVHAQVLLLREIRDDSNVRLIEVDGWHPTQATRVAGLLEQAAARVRAYAIAYEAAHPELSLDEPLPESIDDSTEVLS